MRILFIFLLLANLNQFAITYRNNVKEYLCSYANNHYHRVRDGIIHANYCKSKESIAIRKNGLFLASNEYTNGLNNGDDDLKRISNQVELLKVNIPSDTVNEIKLVQNRIDDVTNEGQGTLEIT